MKCFVITLPDEESNRKADHCIQSTKLDVQKFDAVLPEQTTQLMREHNISWNYPWNGHQELDISTGLLKIGYNTAVKEKRIACFLSHYLLWKSCAESNEDHVILEHDAHFERELPIDSLQRSKKTIIALNRPQPGATPSADRYAQLVRHQIPQGKVSNTSPPGVYEIPYVNEDHRVPAGLPGNSAYYMKPEGARKMLNMVSLYGAWPNDALMCKQLLPGHLGIIWPGTTRVQTGTSSTTL